MGIDGVEPPKAEAPKTEELKVEVEEEDKEEKTEKTEAKEVKDEL